jgi:hypothetical protein
VSVELPRSTRCGQVRGGVLHCRSLTVALLSNRKETKLFAWKHVNRRTRAVPLALDVQTLHPFHRQLSVRRKGSNGFCPRAFADSSGVLAEISGITRKGAGMQKMSLDGESRTHDNAPAAGARDGVTGDGIAYCCRAFLMLWTPSSKCERAPRSPLSVLAALRSGASSSPISGAV